MSKKRVFIAGHRGLVGSATTQEFSKDSRYEVIVRSHSELDLLNRDQVFAFFAEYSPDYLVVCAAKVGGIFANSTYPVDFLHLNLQIQMNLFDAAYANNVERLIFLGSSCIYPKECSQPIKENMLLSGPLELTNRPYALAKIAGIESCWAYNRQYGTKYLALMPTNMYGLNDNYHPENSHVLPALIRRFHEAKVQGADSIVVWGSGTPRREFLYSADLGKAIKHFLDFDAVDFDALLASTTEPPIINIGQGSDISIKELAELITKIVGYDGKIEFDLSKPDGTYKKLMDVTKANQLGWQASISLIDGIELAYKDFLANYSEGAK